MKNTEKYPDLLKLLDLSDSDIKIIQQFFPKYLNLNDLSKVEAFELGMIATEFVYNIRTLKERLAEADKVKYNVSTNNYVLKKLTTYPGLVDFLITELENSFNNLSELEKYDYVKTNPFSYFKPIKDDKVAVRRQKLMFNLINFEK